VAELQKMKDDAEAAGVGVLMGYNKVSVTTIGLSNGSSNAHRNFCNDGSLVHRMYANMSARLVNLQRLFLDHM
jgi:hypothetical protein